MNHPTPNNEKFKLESNSGLEKLNEMNTKNLNWNQILHRFENLIVSTLKNLLTKEN